MWWAQELAKAWQTDVCESDSARHAQSDSSLPIHLTTHFQSIYTSRSEQPDHQTQCSALLIACRQYLGVSKAWFYIGEFISNRGQWNKYCRWCWEWLDMCAHGYLQKSINMHCSTLCSFACPKHLHGKKFTRQRSISNHHLMTAPRPEPQLEIQSAIGYYVMRMASHMPDVRNNTMNKEVQMRYSHLTSTESSPNCRTACKANNTPRTQMPAWCCISLLATHLGWLIDECTSVKRLGR